MVGELESETGTKADTLAMDADQQALFEKFRQLTELVAKGVSRQLKRRVDWRDVRSEADEALIRLTHRWTAERVRDRQEQGFFGVGLQNWAKNFIRDWRRGEEPAETGVDELLEDCPDYRPGQTVATTAAELCDELGITDDRLREAVGRVVSYYPDGGLPANDPERRQWYREDRPHLREYLAELYGEDFSRWAK